MLFSTLSPLLFLFETSFAACKYKFIHNASELIDFSNDVNSGTTYEGYTVYLVDDITFDEQLSKQFEPIGKEINNYFLGTFDGQGYAVSNLVVSLSSTNKIGIFGYSTGITIKNIIVDNSCSFSCSFQNTNTPSNMGGIIANLGAVKSQCIVENCVNMAKISYLGISTNIFIGGITGQVGSTSSHGINIVNCVNYGTLYNSGSSLDNIRMGGIVPEIYENSGNNNNFLYNCLNYGTITNIGQANSGYYIGGIIAISWGSKIANCVSIGAISSNAEDRTGGFISALRNDQTTFSNCYWTSDTGRTQYSGERPTIDGADISLISISSNIVSSLNNYAMNNKWDEWAYNNGKIIKFIVHNGKGFSYSSSLILLPNPERRGYAFLFWCINQNSTNNCITKYVHSDSGFTAATTLYAQWVANSCAVTLDVNGGNTIPSNKRSVSVPADKAYNYLLIPTRRGYTFAGWYTEDGGLITNDTETTAIITKNQILYAHWTANNYTVSFDVNGGDEFIEEEDNNKTVTFNSTYEDLPVPTKEGYSFVGWFTVDNEKITNESIVKIANDHTLYARWTEIPTNKVEVIFNSKDLSKKEIIDAIKQYTKDEFTIVHFEDTSGEINVIIEFNDVTSAVDFVENIRSTSDSITKNLVKSVKYIFSNTESFNPSSYPFIPFTVFVL